MKIMQGIITKLLLVAAICVTCSKASLPYGINNAFEQNKSPAIPNIPGSPDSSDIHFRSLKGQQHLPQCYYCKGAVEEVLFKESFISCSNVNEKEIIHVRCIFSDLALSFNLDTEVPGAYAPGTLPTNSRKRPYPYQGFEFSSIESFKAPTLPKKPNLGRKLPLLNRLLDGDPMVVGSTSSSSSHVGGSSAVNLYPLLHRSPLGNMPLLGRGSAFVYCACSTCANDVRAGFIRPLKDSIKAIETNDYGTFLELMQANYALALTIATMVDIDGSTCLMLASKQGNLPIVRWLSSHGSDVTSRNKANKMALDYAENRAVRDFLMSCSG